MSTAQQIVTAVRRAVIHLSTQGGQFARAHGLNLTDIRALILLLDLQRAGQAATPGALGHGLRLASASTTQVIDRLEHRDLVRRERDATDRRRVLVQVTDAAITAGVSAFDPLLRAVEGLASALPESDQRVVLDFLEQLATVEMETEPQPG